jgi:xylulokinase
MDKYIIGVDIGTQSTKALIAGTDGSVLAQASVAYHPDTPEPLWAQQDARVWLDAFLRSVRECVAHALQKGVQQEQIAGLCISSLYGGAGIPVDASCQPLYPCLIWMDRRATAQTDAIREQVDLERLFEITGNGVDSYYGFTKMLWIKHHEPQIWEKTAWFLPPNTWIAHYLTGKLAVDHSSAGNIGGVYDMQRHIWSDEAMRMVGLDPAKMPPVLLESTDVVGSVTADKAAQLGLAHGIPIVLGGIDAAIATFAGGVRKPGDHVAMLGTSMCWGYLQTETESGRDLVCMPYVYKGLTQRYVFGGAATAGGAVTWFVEQFCQAELAQAKQQGISVYTLLEQQAAPLPPGAHGLVFLPYLMGERSPVWDARASGTFAGLNLTHTRSHLYRAVIEGIAFALWHNMRAVGDRRHDLDQRLVVVGGAVNSDLWMQIIADVTGYPVYTIEEAVEAAMGAALLGAVGLGLVSEAEVEQGWTHVVCRATPNERAHQTYQQLFAVYEGLYPAMKSSMHALATMRGAG